MLQRSISLYDLLKPNTTNGSKIAWDNAIKEEDIRKIREKLQLELSSNEWGTVKQEIYQQLDKLLDLSLGEILAKTWARSPQVKDVIEKQNEEMSSDIAVIPLAEHKIRSVHEPKLNVILDNENIALLPLTAKFIFQLNGVLLKIQHGKIQMPLSGKCKGIASLLYQDIELQEKQIPKFDLPEAVNLIKTQKELKIEEALVGDILTQEKLAETTSSVKATVTKKDVAYVPISLAKKVALLTTGVFIAFLVIFAVMIIAK